MSIAFGLGRFGDRRLEKGGPRCTRPWLIVLAVGSGELRDVGRRRCGSGVFCVILQ
jgi:hypothetical protein